MLTQTQAYAIAHEWIDKWNGPQLADYCLLYDDDAEELSSIANRLITTSNGRVRGKETLTNYWELLRNVFNNHKYILQNSHLYDGNVVIHFTISALQTDAIAKIELNNERKIEKIKISHV